MAKFGKSTGGSKSKKDNKGPKGKKARAKAKLEKQWGETVVYDHGRETTRRHQQRGGDRRPNFDRQQNHSSYATSTNAVAGSMTKSSLGKTYNNRKDGHNGHDDDRYNKSQNMNGNDDDDDDDDDDGQQEENPLDGLLSMIRKTSRNKKKTISMAKTTSVGNSEDEDDDVGPSHLDNDSMSDDDDDDDDDDSVSDSDEDDDNDSETDVRDSDDDDDDAVGIMMTDGRSTNGQKDGHNGKKIVDIFRQRFSQQPLPSSVVDDENSLAVPNITKKIIVDRHSSNDVVELNVSIPKYRDVEVIGGGNRSGTSSFITSKTLSENDKSNQNTAVTEELVQDLPNVDWQDVVMSTFQSTNRSILRRRWMKQIGVRKGTRPSSIMPNRGATSSRNKPQDDQVDDLHASVYSFIARYADMFVTTSSPSMSPNRQLKEQRSFHQMYLLHVLNHVLTSRSRITRNNRELKEKEEENEESGEDDDVKEDKETNNHDEDPDRYRDQGFTRPTVLVLLPTRGTCHRFVKDLYRLTGSSWNQDIKERFETEYGPINDEMDEDDGGDNDDRTTEKEQRRKAVLEKKGKEWNELFGDNANNDDDFKLGVSLTPKVAKTSSPKNSSNVAVRVYTDFFKSDIVVASPLGLKMLILPDESGNGDDDDDDDLDRGRETRKGNNANYDFLSSIEICLIEYAETILMQNWDHVNDILDYLNQEPQSNNNADFSRVRNYLLNGQGQYWRQLILSSKFVDPTLNSFFKRFGKSLSGLVKVRRKISNEDAAVSNVLVPIKQVFQKVKSPSLAQQGQARVDFFVKNILPQIERQKQTHTLVYIPSYFDFCAARNALLKRDISFVSITEYSRTSEVGRGRARFLQGRKPLMLYTGRAHFFHRHSIRGVKHLIFLGVPEHSEFYSDHANMIGSVLGDSKRAVVEGDEMAIIETSSCLTLFTKYEAHALERVVGSKSCTRMIGGTKSTFMFYT